MRRDATSLHAAWILLVSLLPALGCGNSSDNAGSAPEVTGAGAGPGGPSTGTGTGAGGVNGGVSVDAGSGGSNLPPEREVESSYKTPVATGMFVWVANPTSGRVAYVNAQTMAVRTVEAGNGPTFLAA